MPAARLTHAILLLLFPAILAGAQQAPGKDAAPFVTRLKAVAGEARITLTWKDSPDLKAASLVFRSPEEITEKNLPSAALVARVSPGVEFYIDTPPDGRNYFYAVILEDDAGKRYPMLVPFRNTTIAPVALLGAAAATASRITGIAARVTPDASAIELSFRSSSPDRDLLVFWGTSPLLTPEDLLHGASKALDPGAEKYLVPATPGIDYYFAVLDAGLYKVGQAPLTQGENTTVQPLQIPPGKGEEPRPVRPGRALPLPALQLASTVEGGRELAGSEPTALPQPKPVSAATEQAISRLLAGIRAPDLPEMTPQVLEDDRSPAVSGERTALQQIVTEGLASGKYEEAERLIRNFLNIPRKPDLEARAHYYLGQALYLRGQPREAVLEFLLAEDQFYGQTRPWLDACYRKLSAADTAG